MVFLTALLDMGTRFCTCATSSVPLPVTTPLSSFAVLEGVVLVHLALK